jgi:hypothetical protein
MEPACALGLAACKEFSMFKVVSYATTALALSACSGSPSTEDRHAYAPESGGASRAPAHSRSEGAEHLPPAPANAGAARPTPAAKAEKGEEGARKVLSTWAHALEERQFRRAWEQFDHPPSTVDAYTRWWSRYRTIAVSIGMGRSEGAAGSIYYTAPATLTGRTNDSRPFRMVGEVVLRRVNEVPGAAPRQLRWHIESADLKNAPV